MPLSKIVEIHKRTDCCILHAVDTHTREVSTQRDGNRSMGSGCCARKERHDDLAHKPLPTIITGWIRRATALGIE